MRDSMLACAGSLDKTLGGPEIPTEQATQSPRRSMYFVQHGEAQMLFLSTFDGANPCECYRRTSTVLPAQALALTNSELLIHYARTCADRLSQQIQRQALVDISSNSALSPGLQELFKSLSDPAGTECQPRVSGRVGANGVNCQPSRS